MSSPIRVRLKAFFAGPEPWTGLSFFVFGLINNILYVLILSAAVDLVPATTPKGLVLLANILPATAAKLLAPYVIHLAPFGARMFSFAALSIVGMLAVAWGSTVDWKLLGIAAASLSSGLGELSFLGLSGYYSPLALAAWGSGTGAAGLVGAGVYALATNTLGFTSTATILSSSFLPLLLVLCYFFTLPEKQVDSDYTAVHQEWTGDEGVHDTDSGEPHADRDTLLRPAPKPASTVNAWQHFKGNLVQAKSLVFPYMLPLILVYLAEYIAITGVAPVLLFPLETSPFRQLRDFYPAYQALYQAGVFISRSSVLWYRVNRLYIPSLLQVLNLAILTVEALWFFAPTVWIVFALYFWTGLLGGAVYVNAFAKIIDDVPASQREFSLSATSVGDSIGITLAAFMSMGFEKSLCSFQASHGRNFCKEV